jgi:multidrug efflux pump subunit AcrA (membrane-fusion protein)
MNLRRGALAAAFAVLAAWSLSRRSPSTPEVFTVTRGDLVLTVPIEGRLRAVDAYEIGPPGARGIWNFKIASLIPEGREVAKGTPILAFDASELEKRLVQLAAELDSSEEEIERKEVDSLARRRADELRLSEARAKLEKALLKLDRPKELVAERETKALELDRGLAERQIAYLEERRRSLDEADGIDLEALTEQRDRARARVGELKETIARMTVTAPRDGTVVYVADRNGEKKRVGDSIWRRDKVLSVPNLARMEAQGWVDESDAGRVAPGQRVELRLDAYPEIRFTGRVAATGKTIKAPERNSPLLGLSADVELDETDTTRMRPDMRFRGEIEVGRVEEALLVPLAAVEHAGGGNIVYRSRPTGPSPVRVSLGSANETMVEVLAGLSEGDELVAPPVSDR